MEKAVYALDSNTSHWKSKNFTRTLAWVEIGGKRGLHPRHVFALMGLHLHPRGM